MSLNLFRGLSRLPTPPQPSQICHLPWPRVRASSLFKSSASRNYTNHHSLQTAKPSDTNTGARRSLPLDRPNKRPSAHVTDRIAVSAVESPWFTGGRARKKEASILTKYAVIYMLVTSSVLVSIVALPAECARLSCTHARS
jgi:hypothetical protein